ncbi:MAG TPA: alpha-L-arabinofuranosidase C-terminal domain-containing protein [Pyrinomonadaceae bacterium]|nr:alpha-L-arabinofuranosidase C-terminal domain-containing protein [Pyrinomonadaceae bacterium]
MRLRKDSDDRGVYWGFPRNLGIVTPLVVLVVVLFSLHVTHAQDANRASIVVDARKVENRISPLLYGQFLEFMYEGIKGGVHAELLRDRSFGEQPNVIGLPRNWERYPDERNDDYALNFAHDERLSYPPEREFKVETGEAPIKEHSLRVEAGNGVITRRGFYQPRIPIRAGLEYRGYVWLKTTDYKGAVTVALESDVSLGEIYAAADIEGITGDWRKHEFNLKPTKTDPLARFVLLFPGRGRIWVDQVSLMPGDVAPGGVRREVYEKIKALNPAFIRWPGGNVAQDYRWLWGVGPRDKRVTWANLSWKNEPEPSDFGTDEFILFSKSVGAEPSITVNVEGRGATVDEAAAWVEYCNGPATSKYGALRAANGHPEPFAVKFWEVGNEIWGNWVRGHSDAGAYAKNYNRYAQAMRAVDPSIKLIAVGDNNMEWNRTVLRTSGRNIDYLAIHHYYGRREMAGDPLNLMARPLFLERFYGQVKQMLEELVPGRVIKLAINEWGLDLPVERQYSMESALYGARLMNVFERTGDLVEQSAVSDLVNGWPGGIIQVGRHGLFVSPLYLVNELYNSQRGAERLAAIVSGPLFDSSKEGKNVPYLDAVASRSSDGKRIFIKAVNTNPTNDLTTSVELHGVDPGAQAELRIVTAQSLKDANDFLRPNAVFTTTRKIPAGPNFNVTLPKHSVAVITLEVR